MSFLWIFVIISFSVANATETPKLIIYEHKTGNGKELILEKATENFDDLSWGNNEASSVQAVEGTWILYGEKDYAGFTLLVREGERISVGEFDQDFKNDYYSSAKPVSSAIILYENNKNEDNGKTLALGEATSDFGSLNWGDDVASSVRAVKGNWELYEHKNYEGDRMLVSEGGRIDVVNNDHYSSVRPVCTYQNDPTTARIKVFENEGQQGPEKDFTIDHANLADDSWNDRISSIRVYAGEWELYKNANYEGDRIVVKKGDKNTEQINVNNDHYSSLRPVCESYSPSLAACNLTGITVHNTANMAQKDDEGTQIVGIIVDASCAGKGNGHLVMDRTDSVEESVGIETAHDNEVNWSVSVSVTVGYDAPLTGGPSSEFSVEAGVGGSHTYSTSKSTETTNGYSQSVGFEFDYATPAVAVLFGSVDKYKISAADVPITNHLKCPVSTEYPDGLKNVSSTVSLTATTYQSADYWYLVKDLPQDVCDAHYKEIYTCMQQFKESYSKKFAARENVKASFEACFNFDTSSAATESPVYKVQIITVQVPEYIEVSSNGGAATAQSSKMGIYKLQDEYRNNFPVWKKQGEDKYLFVNSNKYWAIGSDLDTTISSIYNNKNNPTPVSPLTLTDDWWYYDDEWKYDNTIRIEAFTG